MEFPRNRPQWWRTINPAGWAFIVLCTASITLLPAVFLWPRCDLEVQTTVLSPTKDLYATAFELGCGATERLNTRVAVYPSWQSLSDGPLVFATYGRYDVRMTWNDAKTLQVAVYCRDGWCGDPRIAKPFVFKQVVGEIRIHYVYSKQVQAAMKGGRDGPRGK